MSAHAQDLLLKEEVHRVIGCAMKVLNGLGHGLLAMTNQRHSWVEVDPGALQEALRQLAKLSKPLKRFRKSILWFADGPVREFDAAKTLHQIRELYPDSSSYGVIEFNLVTLPAFPNLVIYVRPACVEFRILTDLAGSPTDWRTPSEIWKRLDHAIVRELGLDVLIQWAGETAAQKAKELRLHHGEP